MSEPLAVTSSRIRHFVTGQGHDYNIVAAARLCADSDTVLRKVRAFVDSDGWIEWEKLAEYVDGSGWSSGEKAAIRLACSLAGYGPETTSSAWLLASTLAPLDSGLRRLAVEAIRYAIDGPARDGGARFLHDVDRVGNEIRPELTDEQIRDVDLVHNLILGGLSGPIEVLGVDGNAVTLRAPGRNLRITVARS